MDTAGTFSKETGQPELSWVVTSYTGQSDLVSTLTNGETILYAFSRP